MKSKNRKMKKVILAISIISIAFSACKKEEIVEKPKAPTVLGSWKIIQTETTHELGHYGPYDPPVRDVDSRETLIVDHQNEFSTLDITTNSLTWTDVDLGSKLYNWEYANKLFSISSSDTTMDYHVINLTTNSFVFFIKDFRTYNDSTNLVAYEEYEYVYHLDRTE